MTPLTVILPGLPPALNHQYAYAGMRGGKRRTPEAVAWQTGATAAFRSAANTAGWRLAPRTPLAVVVGLDGPDIYRWDIDGRLKCLLDALAAGLDHDDRWIVNLTVRKVRVPAARSVTRVMVMALADEE